MRRSRTADERLASSIYAYCRSHSTTDLADCLNQELSYTRLVDMVYWILSTNYMVCHNPKIKELLKCLTTETVVLPAAAVMDPTALDTQNASTAITSQEEEFVCDKR